MYLSGMRNRKTTILSKATDAVVVAINAHVDFKYYTIIPLDSKGRNILLKGQGVAPLGDLPMVAKMWYI